jgi:hypothetical protein
MKSAAAEWKFITFDAGETFLVTTGRQRRTLYEYLSAFLTVMTTPVVMIVTTQKLLYRK